MSGMRNLYNHRASRPMPNSTPETFGTLCNLCPKLDCIEIPKARIHKWHYYCEARYENIDVYKIGEEDCPLGRKFNRKGGSRG